MSAMPLWRGTAAALGVCPCWAGEEAGRAASGHLAADRDWSVLEGKETMVTAIGQFLKRQDMEQF